MKFLKNTKSGVICQWTEILSKMDNMQVHIPNTDIEEPPTPTDALMLGDKCVKDLTKADIVMQANHIFPGSNLNPNHRRAKLETKIKELNANISQDTIGESIT
jgi:hypothetical protein